MPSGLVRAGAMWGAAALALVLAGQISAHGAPSPDQSTSWLGTILRTDPDSFRGKIYLQLFDKLLLGVIIAAAFVAYDRYKDADAKRFQKEMAQLNNRMEQERAAGQQALERTRILGELIPLLRDKNADALARAYILHSAVRIDSIDPDTAVELASSLFVGELTQDQFVRVMAVVIPEGIPAIARQGVRLSGVWRQEQQSAFSPGTTFDPVSGVEHIPVDMPQDQRKTLAEGRAWRQVLFEALPKLDDAHYAPLEDTKTLPKYLYGLFVLLSPGDSFQASDLSRRNCRAMSLIGNLDRVLFSGTDANAVKQVSRELNLGHLNLDNIRLALVIVSILQEYGPPSGPIAEPLARILTEQNVGKDQLAEVQSAHFWMQFEAGELLTKMDNISSAEPVLIDFVSRFGRDVRNTDIKDEKELDALSSRWESGKLLRLAVECLGKIGTYQAGYALDDLTSAGEIWPAFPFLKEDIERARKLK